MFKKLSLVMVVMAVAVAGISGVVASQGLGTVIFVPRINAEVGWSTLIQVQNVGDTNTGAVIFFWGTFSGNCPPNDPGPIQCACRSILRNGVWAIEGTIPEGAKSAIIYSVAEDLFQEACEAATASTSNERRVWAEDYGGTGESLTVVIHRSGPNEFGTPVSSAYTGIPQASGEGAYTYLAPYAMRGYHGLDTELTIQNTGEWCASPQIQYREQGSGRIGADFIEHIECLAPGEAVKVRVPRVSELGGSHGWLGSATIIANQPLAIITDQTSIEQGGLDRGVLSSARLDSVGALMHFAAPIFREWGGWQTGIQVQNLHPLLPAFVTVEFLASDGGHIIFLGDWVEPSASTTFFLPAIVDIGNDYVGAAEIQSHNQVGFPGGEADGQDVAVVVDLKYQFRPGEDLRLEPQAGSYPPHRESEIKGVYSFALPFVAREYEGITSMIAIRNNSGCNEIRQKIEFYTDAGDLVCESSSWLAPGHLKLIDLQGLNCLVPGWAGSAMMTVEEVNQLCDVDGDGHADQEQVMPSVVVLNRAEGFGDATSAYPGIPIP